jgi:hypothetical protein
VPDAIARAEIADGAVLSRSGALTVSATLENTIATTAEGGAKGETAVAPVVAVTVANQDAVARIGSGAATAATGQVNVASSLKSTNTTKAEGKAEGSKDAAVGAAIAVNVERDRSSATVNRSLSQTTGVAVTASSQAASTASAKASAVGGKEDDSNSAADDKAVDDQNAAARGTGDSAAAAGGARNSSSSQATPSAQGTGGGTVSVAAAVAVNIAHATSSASVGGGNIASSGAVRVTSSADHDAKATADGSTRAKDADNPNDTGVGVAVAVNVGLSTNEARVLGTSSITSQGLTVSAGMPADATHTTAAEAKSGAGGAKTGIAGSLAVNVAVDRTTAEVATGATVNAGTGASSIAARTVHADSAKATPASDAGPQVEAKDTGVGASVAVNVPDLIARAEIANGATLSSSGALSVTSVLENTIITTAQGGAKGGTAVAPVVAVTVANQDSIARIGTGTLLQAAGDLTVAADLRSTNNSTAKGKAEGNKDAAVGAAVTVNVELDRADAEVARAVTGTGAVSVAGTSRVSTTAKAEASAVGGEQDDGTKGSGDDDGVNKKTAAGRGLGNSAAGSGGARNADSAAATPSAGVASTDSTSGDNGSSETVSVAAAVAVNITEATSRSRITAGTVTSPTGNVSVQSSANTDAQAVADGSATTGDGGDAVGAAVAINVANTVNQAQVASGVAIVAGGLQIGAMVTGVAGDTTHTTLASAKSGAGGGDVGVAGSVAVNVVNEDTLAQLATGATATLSGADSGGALRVTTASTSSDSALAKPENEGAQAGGSDVGVGASVGVSIIDRNQDATLDDGAQVSGNVSAFTVSANGQHTIVTDTENGAKGGTGVGVAAAVTVATNNTHAHAGTASGTLVVAGDAAVRAARVEQVTASAKAEAAGKDTAVGASVVVTVIDGDASARLERNLTVGGAADVSSAATVLATGTAKASAAGNSSGGRSSDKEANNQLNNNPNNGGDRSLPKAQDQVDSSNTQAKSESGGSGSSGTGVAAAVVVQVLVMDNTAAVGPGVQLQAGGAVTVDAQADYGTVTQAFGDAIDIAQKTNVGAAVGLNVVDASNVAQVGSGADVRGASVLVRADRPGDAGEHEFRAWGLAAAGGKDTGVAGSVAINVVTLDTAASVGSGATVVATAGNLDVVADQRTGIQTVAGAAGLSTGGTGVGASVGLNIAVERTNATAGSNARLAAAGTTTVGADAALLPLTIDLPDPLPDVTVSNLSI